MARSSGGHRRCGKGKPCGATCISKFKTCLKYLEVVKDDVVKVRDTIKDRQVPAIINKPKIKDGGRKDLEMPSGKIADKESKKDELPLGKESERAKYSLNYLYDPDVKTKEVDGEAPASKINWRAGVEGNSQIAGKGASADFIIVQPDSLMKGLQARFPNGVGVKYGLTSAEEVNLSRKIGESGAGPRVIAARLEDKKEGKGVGQGMIALERIPGRTIDNLIDEGRESRTTLNDAFLKGLALLHKAGISHGDAHFSNAIYQPNGKVRLVDFGFSKEDPARAFSEALKRGLSSESRGAVQDKIRDNFYKVLQRLGRTDIKSELQLRLEIGSIISKSNPDKNKIYMELINLLYDGV